MRVLSTAFSSDVTVAVVVCGEQGLMRELELREKKMNNVQATGDKLLRDGHPARSTVEVRAFAMAAAVYKRNCGDLDLNV